MPQTETLRDSPLYHDERGNTTALRLIHKSPRTGPEIDDQQRDKILDELRIFRQHLRRNGSAS